nr:hypothetical protein [Tanacetum cinerariifolium]
MRDVSEGETCPTESGFIADQDRATIAKSSTLPYDSAPRVTSLAVDEGNMQHNISELTALCTSLEGVAAKQFRDDAPIKGWSINEREEAANSRQYTRRARIAQSSALPIVANEFASPVRDVSEGEACPTESGFIANQDRATIAKSSTLPHDLAPKVTSLAADEGSMEHNISKLMALCTSLQRQYSELLVKFQAQEEEIVRLKEGSKYWRIEKAQEEEIVKLKDRVKVLEDKEGVAAKQSGDDAPIKGRSINEGEAATERISNDSEEITRVLTSMDAATVLAGGIDVPTGSGFIPTAGSPATVISTGSEVGPTASPIVTRRKGKEVMVESDTPKKKKLQEHIDAQVARELEEQQEKESMRMNEQITRNAKAARIRAEEEL